MFHLGSEGKTATSSKGSSTVACLASVLLQAGLLLHPVEGMMVHLHLGEETGLMNVT